MGNYHKTMLAGKKNTPRWDKSQIIKNTLIFIKKQHVSARPVAQRGHASMRAPCRHSSGGNRLAVIDSVSSYWFHWDAPTQLLSVATHITAAGSFDVHAGHTTLVLRCSKNIFEPVTSSEGRVCEMTFSLSVHSEICF